MCCSKSIEICVQLMPFWDCGLVLTSIAVCRLVAARLMLEPQCPDINFEVIAQPYVSVWPHYICITLITIKSHDRHGVTNHRQLQYLFNPFVWAHNIGNFRVTGPCDGNSLLTGGLPSQSASNVENGSISWLFHAGARDKQVRVYLYVNVNFADVADV